MCSKPWGSALFMITCPEFCCFLLGQARTQLIGLFDADMLPSHTLFEELQHPENVDR